MTYLAIACILFGVNIFITFTLDKIPNSGKRESLKWVSVIVGIFIMFFMILFTKDISNVQI